jgi:hypothetical protein
LEPKDQERKKECVLWRSRHTNARMQLSHRRWRPERCRLLLHYARRRTGEDLRVRQAATGWKAGES